MKKISFLPIDYVDCEAFSVTALRWALHHHVAPALRRAHHSECACSDVCGHWQSHTVAVAHHKRREWLVTVHHFRND